MQLLHTADLHLRTDRPETIQTLDSVLTAARTRDVDIVTIGGDLFDRPADANELRPTLRDRFQDTPFDVFVIPGNHDADAFSRNVAFGRRLDALVDSPCEQRTIGGVSLVGVPYTTEFTDSLYERLHERSRPGMTNVLLLHCTLDIGFSASDIGDERRIQYCPVQLATLAELEYDYVLAGHIHSRFEQRPLGDGRPFIYPGSPISHARTETGPRHVALIDTDERQVEQLQLDTFYYDTAQYTVTPDTEEEILREIAAWTDHHAAANCEVEVVVDGFIAGDEQEFAERLQQAATSASVSNRIRDVSEVYQHPLYQRFRDKLADRERANAGQVERLFVRALDSLIASGEVRT